MKHIDCILYVGIGVCTALTNSFTNEAAAKFLDPATLFYFTAYLSALNAGLLAAKMYRSTTFAEQKLRDVSTTTTNTVTEIKQAAIETPKP